MLEHHADLAAANLSEPIGREREQVLAVDPDLSRGRVVEPVDHPHQRRLARTRQAHDDEDLAGRTSNETSRTATTQPVLARSSARGSSASGEPTTFLAFAP